MPIPDVSTTPIYEGELPDVDSMSEVTDVRVITATGSGSEKVPIGEFKLPSSQIPYDPSASGLEATNTKEAIDELTAKVNTKENAANKKTVINDSDTEFPTSKAVKTALDLKLDKANVYNGLDKTEAGFVSDARTVKAIYDSYLESLPTVGIAVQQSGDGSASTTMRVYTLIATTATITGGTFSGGLTTLTIPARTNTNVIFSLSLSKGLIQIKGLSKIISVTTPTNAPILAREAAWVLPSVMTTFNCAGSNTLSGVLSLPPVMTSFNCTGNNTLSGVLSLPSVMTSFSCSGGNTLSGVLSLPSVMTDFYCAGGNTLTGVLSLPSVMTFFTCSGSNTLKYPSAGVNVFPTTFRQFSILPQSNWTSAMTDAVLIDAAATITTASNEKTFNIRGNAGVRTSASDSAKAYLESIGFTVFTN